MVNAVSDHAEVFLVALLSWPLLRQVVDSGKEGIEGDLKRPESNIEAKLGQA